MITTMGRGRTWEQKSLAILAVLALFASLITVYAPQAAAEHDEYYPGDSTYNNAIWWEDYLDDHDGVSNSVCVKIDVESETNYVANADYRLVIVNKGAGDQANRLYWNVESGDVLAPGPGQGDGVGYSHVITCTNTPDEPEPGAIIVEKWVTDGSDESRVFDFDASFTLDDNTLAHGETGMSGDLDAGVYWVGETVPDGWTLESATCDDGSDPGAIDVSEGETVTCTFVNHEVETYPEPGKIIVVKTVTEGSDEDTEFEFETDFSFGPNNLSHGEMGMSGELSPGIYSVEEINIPDGWTLESATCDDGSDPGAIDVSAGETVTCTFVNDEDEVEVQPGEIIVVKLVTEGSDEDTEFEFDSDFGLDDDSLAHGDMGMSGDLDPGSYSVEEINIPDGWTLESATCDDGSDPASIDVSEGETVTCIFVNDEDEVEVQPGMIIVVKTVLEGSDESTEFEFDSDFALDDNTLAHGEMGLSGDLDPGIYSVEEINIPDDWELSSATCDDGSDPAAIDVSAGETVTCTFVNGEVEVLPVALPEIDVTKTAGVETVEAPGENVTFTVVITNTSPTVAVTLTSLVDDIYGTLAGDADCRVGTVLAPLASCSFDFVGFVGGEDGDQHRNVVTVNGEDDSRNPVDADDDATVRVLAATVLDVTLLPFTGSDSDLLMTVSLILLLTGAAMIFAGRRRVEA